MRTMRIMLKFAGLGLLVVADLLRPTRPAYRMPARWLAH